MTAGDYEGKFRRRLRGLGLTDQVVDAAWPEWWSDEAADSRSARAELKFSVARKLGLDARSLVDDQSAPQFIWTDETKFKNLRTESEVEKRAISSFGFAVGSLLAAGTAVDRKTTILTARELRSLIIARQPVVRLMDLLSATWVIGIPTIYLRIFPSLRKRMAAMSVSMGERHAILLARDSLFPAPIAFNLAHELGHIALGHVSNHGSVVDFKHEPDRDSSDPDELEADSFALELLTGDPKPEFLPQGYSGDARSLAMTALELSTKLSIEAGTLALCFGYSTKDWATAYGALRYIYASPKPVWHEVNHIAAEQLSFSEMPSDSRTFLHTVMGFPT